MTGEDLVCTDSAQLPYVDVHHVFFNTYIKGGFIIIKDSSNVSIDYNILEAI